jgi:hypothetical protein
VKTAIFHNMLMGERVKRNMVEIRVRFGAQLAALSSPAILMLLTVQGQRPSVFIRSISLLFVVLYFYDDNFCPFLLFSRLW